MTNTASILLVDDDAELLTALTKVLEKDGYDVVPQSSANAAFQFITESHRRFDLVITDVSMPGMSGLVFLSAIKTALPNVPVVVITAYGDWGQYMEAMREGACEYLTKPVDKTELLAAIRRSLSAAPQFQSTNHNQTTTQ